MEKIHFVRAAEMLKSSFLFCGCDDAVFDRHINEATCDIAHYNASSTIYKPKNYKKSLGVVLSGKVIANSRDEAKQVLLRSFEAGEIFGVAGLFANDVDFATNIIAKTECDILFIGDEIVYSLIENDSAVRKNYITFLSDKIRFLNQKITYFTAGSAERKLSMYLLSLKRQDETVILPLSMSALSEMLDVGRASLYRAFDRLTEDGFILRKEKEVQLLLPEKMKEYYK